MLFMVGIERPQEDTSWGIVVPVFEQFGYGCVSAADEQKEILYRAKAAILEMAAEMVADGHNLASLDVGYTDYRKTCYQRPFSRLFTGCDRCRNRRL